MFDTIRVFYFEVFWGNLFTHVLLNKSIQRKHLSLFVCSAGENNGDDDL